MFQLEMEYYFIHMTTASRLLFHFFMCIGSYLDKGIAIDINIASFEITDDGPSGKMSDNQLNNHKHPKSLVANKPSASAFEF